MLGSAVVFLGLWVMGGPVFGGQDASFPLEDVKISGSRVPAAVVMEIGGLKLGQSVNKADIEVACQKLGQSGIFESVNYGYAPGPKKGYVVTLELTDPHKLMDASIDVAGADDKALWTYIETQFPAFQHRVPESDEADQYLARILERKLGQTLHGEKLVIRLERDVRGRALISFQPEHLPRIAAMSFNGATLVPADDLNQLLQKLLGDEGYLDRHFRQLVEEAVRQEYWKHGLFKVQFPAIQAQFVNPMTVNVATNIVEGPQFKLADVQLVGDDLPADAMLNAAKFKKGEMANWTDIQQAIWRAEVPVKRTGYLDAQAQPERVLDDTNQTLLLKLSVRKGQLYHFGRVRFVGLSPELEAKASALWKMQTGEPFDFMYANEFLKAFSKVTDLRAFKKIQDKVEPGVGDHVRNLTVSFLDK